MDNLVKIISHNRKVLILILGIGLFLSPQIIKISSASAQDYSSFYCKLLGGTSNNYQCIGTVPSACNNKIVEPISNCVTKCREANGFSASWGTQTSYEPSVWYCCNIQRQIDCGNEALNNKRTLVPAFGIEQIDLSKGTLLPPQSSNCQQCGITSLDKCLKCIGESLSAIVLRFLAAVVGLIVLLIGAISSIIIGLLDWLIKSVLAVPITNVGFVRVCWAFTRDFANMFFILILAFIGLATILKLEEYEVKKALPRLIIAVILINFSLVIIGFVVDMGNILTGFFLRSDPVSALKASSVGFGTANQYFSDMTSNFWDAASASAQLTFGIVLIFFYLLSALIYFIIFLVFFFRIIVLWILAILAPIAFLSFSLGKAKGKIWEAIFPGYLNFDSWAEELARWALVGIPMAFFMFLAGYTSKAIVNDLGKPGDLFYETSTAATFAGQGIPSGTANFLGKTLASVVPLVILVLGAIISMKAAPEIAGKIIGWGKGAGMGLGKWAGKKAAITAGRWATPFLDKQGRRLEAAGTKEGLFGKNKLLAPARLLTRWAGRGMWVGSERIHRNIKTQDEMDIANARKESLNKDSNDNIRRIKEQFLKGANADWNVILGSVLGTCDNGDQDDLSDSFFKKDGLLYGYKDQVKKILKTGLNRMGSAGYTPMLKAVSGNLLTDPGTFGYNAKFVEGNTGEFDEYTGTGDDAKELKRLKNKVFEKLKSDDFQGGKFDPDRNLNADEKNLSPDGKVKVGQIMLKWLAEYKQAQFMPQLVQLKDKDIARSALEFYYKEGKFENNNNALGETWLVKNGAESIIRYRNSTGARSLGIGTSKTQQETEEIISILKNEQKILNKSDAEIARALGELETAETTGPLTKIAKAEKKFYEEAYDLVKRPQSDISTSLTSIENSIRNYEAIPEDRRTKDDWGHLKYFKNQKMKYGTERDRRIGQRTWTP